MFAKPTELMHEYYISFMLCHCMSQAHVCMTYIYFGLNSAPGRGNPDVNWLSHYEGMETLLRAPKKHFQN